MLSPELGGGHAAARIYHACRRRDGGIRVDRRGASAIAKNAGTGMVSVLPRDTPFMHAFVKRLRELGYSSQKATAISWYLQVLPATTVNATQRIVRCWP